MSKDGSNDFFFKLNGNKHIFQASSLPERDSWLLAVESKSSEAKALKDGIVTTDGYQKNMDKFGMSGGHQILSRTPFS